MTFEASWGEGRPRWRVTFSRYSAYRNTDELHLCDLWRWLGKSGQRGSNAFTVERSRWIAELVEMHPLQHFVICTLDDIVEVAAEVDPVWETLGPAPPDATFVGKVQNLWVREDGAEIDKLRQDLTRHAKMDPPAN